MLDISSARVVVVCRRKYNERKVQISIEGEEEKKNKKSSFSIR
jgi:hypothetical protein